MSFKVIPVKPPLVCPYRINVDSMKMSDHVEFVAPQISGHAEPMAKRLFEGIPLTRGWTHHDMPSLRELMQRSMEPFDSQVKWPVRMNTISIFGILMAPQINPTFWLS